MKDLIHKANVVYVCSGKKIVGGVNTGRDAIVVGVSKKVPLNILAKADRIPKKIKGKETDVVRTDEIRALRTSKHRPAPGGVSIGHPKVTAGTLGMNLRVKDGSLYILSNNHVLANSNDARIGDQIWQPGRADGGGSADLIGHLSKFVPIVFIGDDSGCPIARAFIWFMNNVILRPFDTKLSTISNKTNTVDCAIARPVNDNDVSLEILEVGIPTGFAEAEVGKIIKKSGRTTGLLEGLVEATDAWVNVNYGDGKIATLNDQIKASAMAEGGDSGSVGLQRDEVVGLLFAGSEQTTFFNKIQNVLEQLELEV